MLPLARPEQDGLIVDALIGETLICDTKSRVWSNLNSVATLIWRRCDGQTTIAELAQALHDDLGLAVDEATVWAGLESLRRLNLLSYCPPVPQTLTASARRRLRRRLIVAGGVTFLFSVLAPEALAAGSCVVNHAGCAPKDAACTLDGQCCSCNCKNSDKCQ
jgi:Coenzyme PQQ synthesis protein D (PqqD)